MATGLLLSLVGPASRSAWGSATLLFVGVTLGAGLCCLAAGVAIRVGWVRGMPELTILGAALLAQSMLALVHGLTAPGVLYDANNAVSLSAFLALPVALLVGSPLMLSNTAVGRQVGLRWRTWTVVCSCLALALAVLLLIYPSALPPASLRSPVIVAVGMACMAIALRLSWLQLETYWIGRRPATLAASLALAAIGITGLVWTAEQEMNLGWWLAHVLCVSAVLVACIALLWGYSLDRSVADVLRPVLTREPLMSLRLGLSPTVHAFVEDLARKDRQTREHVVRVAELAMRAGDAFDLPPSRLRTLGLGALLHDIGKLTTPTEILVKPGRLTDQETLVMRRHAADGARLLASEPELADAAPLVRAHHERIDGGGYPDGLSGDRIPLEARIISVCDAYDAMAHTRHYRQGMGTERAFTVLREHAGSQWDPRCVAVVMSIVDSGRNGTFDDVGLSDRDDAAPVQMDEICRDVVPST